jgi:glycosyltransferase involved in cell wall biosynthesis
MTQAARAGLSGYTAEAPLALLTDYPPDTAGGGAVILRSLLGPEERSRLVWMSPTPPSDPAAAGPNVVTLRSGSAGRGRRSVGRDSTIHAGALAREALDQAKARGARAIWVVMHNAAVAIAARLIRRGGLPVHLTVHDDPAFANALRSKRYLALVPWIERDFAFAMKHATSIDVIGRGMAERYRLRYGVESAIVHRALEGPVAPGGPYDRERLGLRVGVLGSTYAYDQLPLLAHAVELASKQLGVKPRLLIMGRSYGDRLKAEVGDAVDVEVTGHVSEADAVPLLRDCFALYLNYPFGRRDAVLRQTSFPTKLSTYIQAARPLLLHVPPDSSVMPLVGPDGFATAWPSLDPASGADALLAAWDRPENLESRRDAAEAVRREYYDPDRNRRALFDALDALVPPVPGPDGRA